MSDSLYPNMEERRLCPIVSYPLMLCALESVKLIKNTQIAKGIAINNGKCKQMLKPLSLLNSSPLFGIYGRKGKREPPTAINPTETEY